MLTCTPIGFLRCRPGGKFVTPRQPAPGAPHGVVELIEGPRFASAVRDLSGFSRIWLVWWFDRHHDWRAQVLPPRGRSRRGVLATRSPHRPNPIGLSAVRLLEVRGTALHIGEHDLLDGTPILDVKPYIPAVDAFPDERSGWIDELEVAPRFRVEMSPLATRQLEWLSEHEGEELTRRILDLLASDPRPHRTRRISALPEGGFLLKSGSWRVQFRLENDVVQLESVGSRFTLATAEGVHRTFLSVEDFGVSHDG